MFFSPFQVLLNVTLIFLNLETPSVKNLKMGRRRSKRKPPPKVKPVMPLDQLFNCPFCNHEKSCDVKMDRQRNIATIRCQVRERTNLDIFQHFHPFPFSTHHCHADSPHFCVVRALSFP